MSLPNNHVSAPNIVWAVVATIIATMILAVIILVFAPDQEKDVAILIGFAAPTIAALLNLARTEDVATKVNGHLSEHVISAAKSDETARVALDTNKVVTETLATVVAAASNQPHSESNNG